MKHLIGIFLLSLPLVAQNGVPTQMDFSRYLITKPFATGTSLPATCTVGQTFFLTGATTPSQSFYACTNINTWTAQGTGTGGEGGAYVPFNGNGKITLSLLDPSGGSPGQLLGLTAGGITLVNPPNGISSIFGRSTNAIVAQASDYSAFYAALDTNGKLPPSLLDPGAGTIGQFLELTAGGFAPATLPSAPIASVFGRTGSIGAQSGDYAQYYAPIDNNGKLAPSTLDGSSGTVGQVMGLTINGPAWITSSGGSGSGIPADGSNQYTILSTGPVPLTLSSNSVSGTKITLVNTGTSGRSITLFNSGTDNNNPGVIGIFDNAANRTDFGIVPATGDFAISSGAAFEFSSNPGSNSPQAQLSSPASGVVQVTSTPGNLGSLSIDNIAFAPHSSLPTCNSSLEGHVELLNGVINTCHGNAWAVSGSGSGGSSGGVLSLGTYAMTASGTNTQAIGTDCTSATPCTAHIGTTPAAKLTSSASFTDAETSGNNDTAYIYVDPVSMNLTVGTQTVSTTCSNCTSVTGITGFPFGSVPLYVATLVHGDVTALVDDRAQMSASAPLTSGTCIVLTPNNGSEQIGLDTTNPACFAGGGTGFTGTKTVGSCVLTISGGIITSVSGC